MGIGMKAMWQPYRSVFILRCGGLGMLIHFMVCCFCVVYISGCVLTNASWLPELLWQRKKREYVMNRN